MRPLLERDVPKYLWNLKALPTPLSAIRGDIVDVMLAAYALNPPRESFDAGSLCAQEGVAGFAAHPATAVRRLAEAQLGQLRENDLDGVYRDIELPLA